MSRSVLSYSSSLAKIGILQRRLEAVCYKRQHSLLAARELNILQWTVLLSLTLFLDPALFCLITSPSSKWVSISWWKVAARIPAVSIPLGKGRNGKEDVFFPPFENLSQEKNVPLHLHTTRQNAGLHPDCNEARKCAGWHTRRALRRLRMVLSSLAGDRVGIWVQAYVEKLALPSTRQYKLPSPLFNLAREDCPGCGCQEPPQPCCGYAH